MTSRAKATDGEEKPANIKFAADAIVSVQAMLVGRITLGPGTVVHPKATIDAGQSEILIGAYNIIEEKSIIENRGSDVMRIGDGNVFEVGAVCYAKTVGNNNRFGIKSETGEGVEVTDHCQIGPKCRMLTQKTLPSHTIVYFEENLRKISSDEPLNQRKQAEFLGKLIPKYTNILKNTQK